MQAMKQELDDLKKERDDIKSRLLSTDKSDILDTIRLNLNQLTEYYTINKHQARDSFNFSVGAIVAGLLILITGMALFYANINSNITVTSITGISGIIVEFIGASYFYLYRKSMEQVNFFFDQLVKMQDTMLSIRLCDNLYPAKKEELNEKIIIALIERCSKPIVRGEIPEPPAKPDKTPAANQSKA